MSEVPRKFGWRDGKPEFSERQVVTLRCQEVHEPRRAACRSD